MRRLPRRADVTVGTNTNQKRVALQMFGDTYFLTPAEALELADRLVDAAETFTEAPE